MGTGAPAAYARTRGQALFEVVLAIGLLSTVVLGALAAELSMARAARAVAWRTQAIRLADARVEAGQVGADTALDWARWTSMLPHGNLTIAPLGDDLRVARVTWDTVGLEGALSCDADDVSGGAMADGFALSDDIGIATRRGACLSLIYGKGAL